MTARGWAFPSNWLLTTSPRGQGGDTDINNLVLLHKECNEEKGHLKQEQFEMRVRRHRAERQGEDWDDDIDHELRVEWLRMWPY